LGLAPKFSRFIKTRIKLPMLLTVASLPAGRQVFMSRSDNIKSLTNGGLEKRKKRLKEYSNLL
jgi:hypothetical protein